MSEPVDVVEVMARALGANMAVNMGVAFDGVWRQADLRSALFVAARAALDALEGRGLVVVPKEPTEEGSVGG